MDAEAPLFVAFCEIETKNPIEIFARRCSIAIDSRIVCFHYRFGAQKPWHFYNQQPRHTHTHAEKSPESQYSQIHGSTALAARLPSVNPYVTQLKARRPHKNCCTQ